MENKFKEVTLMNAILCLGVVLIHLSSYPMMQMEPDGLTHLCVFLVNKGLSYSVPAFLFLSGMKLYGKYSDTKMDLRHFYLGRFKKIVVPYVISVLVYFLYFYIEECVKFAELPEYILFGTLVAHFYYIIIAIQMYLIFPFLKDGLNKYPKAVTIASLAITVCSILFVKFKYSDRFAGAYLIYFVLGMLASKYKLWESAKKIHRYAVAGAVVSGAIHLTLLYKSSLGELIYNYAEVFAILYIVFAIFALYSICLLLKDKFRYLHICANAISKKSFSIYLYHILPIFILQYDVFRRVDLSMAEYFIIISSIVSLIIFLYVIFPDKIFKRNK